MLIQCPSCHARAKLPDDQEGAKVRCGECGRIYLARTGGSRASSKKPFNTGAWIGGFVGFLALVAVLALYRSAGGKEKVQAVQPASAPEKKPMVDFGWSSELVQTVVSIHESSFTHDRERLKTLLHGPRIWARERAAAGEEPGAFASLSGPERAAAFERWADDFTQGSARELVALWKPFDGEAVEVTDEEATVRVAVAPRAGGVEKRWVEWGLARDGERFRAWRWERWFSPAELKAEQHKRAKGFQVVTLSDGSVVFERPPEPLGHLEDTPLDLRRRIDQLAATILDLELTKESARAQRELAEIGRPAIPILLTKFYETPADSDDNCKRCNIIDQTLQRITGQQFGYAPGEAGSVAGTTEERRQSSIKQWFAWWYRNEKRFTTKVTQDGLEGAIELTDEEKQWLERHPDR